MTRPPRYRLSDAEKDALLHEQASNKMARAIWAMLTRKADYRDPTQAAAA